MFTNKKLHRMENFSSILTVTEKVICMSMRVTNNNHVNNVMGIPVQWPNCGQCDDILFTISYVNVTTWRKTKHILMTKFLTEQSFKWRKANFLHKCDCMSNIYGWGGRIYIYQNFDRFSCSRYILIKYTVIMLLPAVGVPFPWIPKSCMQLH